MATMKLAKKCYKTYINLIILIQLCYCIGNSAPKGFFWEVTTPKSKIYLLGSIHLGKKELFPLDTNWENAFESCTNLVVEINTKRINPFTILKFAYFHDTTTLEKILPGDIFAKIDSIFSAHNISKSTFNKFKPWFALTNLVNLEYSNLDFEADLGIDQYFLKRSDSTKKIIEFESFEEQIQFMEQLFSKHPRLYFEYFFNEIESTQKNISELFDAWEDGNDSLLAQLISNSIPNDSTGKEFSEIMITQRNKKMVEKVRNFINDGGCYFIVVGAGHLVGKDGIVQSLKESGFKVERK